MIELTNPTARIENLDSDDYQTLPSQADYKYLLALESGDIKSYVHNPVIGLDKFLLLYFGFNIPISENGVNAALNIVGRRFNFLPIIKNDIQELATAKGLTDLNKITEWLALCSELNFKPCEAVVMAFQGQATQAETADNEAIQALENKLMNTYCPRNPDKFLERFYSSGFGFLKLMKMRVEELGIDEETALSFYYELNEAWRNGHIKAIHRKRLRYVDNSYYNDISSAIFWAGDIHGYFKSIDRTFSLHFAYDHFLKTNPEWFEPEPIAESASNEASQTMYLSTSRPDKPLTKLEKQHHAILEVIKSKRFDPMQIPDGEKGTIEAICQLDYPLLFDAESSFNTAWKKGRHLFKMAHHDGYARRGKK